MYAQGFHGSAWLGNSRELLIAFLKCAVVTIKLSLLSPFCYPRLAKIGI